MNYVAGFHCTYCVLNLNVLQLEFAFFDRLFVENPIPYIAQCVYNFTTLFIIKLAENTDNQLLISA